MSVMNPEIHKAGKEAAGQPFSFDNKHPCSSGEVTAVKTEPNDFSAETSSDTEPEDLLAEDDTKTMFSKYGIKVFKSEEHDMADESESVDVFQADSANGIMSKDRDIEIEKDGASDKSDCDKEMDGTRAEACYDIFGLSLKSIITKTEKGDSIDEINQTSEPGYFGIAESVRTERTSHDSVDSPLKMVIIKTENGDILEETNKPMKPGDLVGVNSTNRTVQGGTTNPAEPIGAKTKPYSVMDLLRGASVLNETSTVKSTVPRKEKGDITKDSSSKKPPKTHKTAQQKPRVETGNEQLVKSETPSSSENCEYNILANEQRAGEKFECPICLKKFQKPAFYVKHVNQHLEDGPYKCKDCSKIFKAPHRLRFHMETKHSNVKPYICSVCNRAFKLMDLLKSHMYTHTGNRKYPCTLCEKSYNKPGLLKEHLATHSSEKPFACNICNKNFRGLRFLKNHVKNHYTKRTSKVGSIKSKPQEKETEKEPTTNNKVVLRHLLTQSKSFPFKCDICSQSFAMQDFLFEHQSTHVVKPPKGDPTLVQCPICKRRFKKDSFLRTHAKKYHPDA